MSTRLCPDLLESRDTPNAVYSYAVPGRPTAVGFVHAELDEFGQLGEVVPFPDYAGPVNTAFHARDTVVVGAGPSGGPRVKVYAASGAAVAERADFFAFEESYRGGVRVAAGDLTGDGAADVVVGAASGGGPRVDVYDGATLTRIASFFAYSPDFRGGVFVGVADPDGDGRCVLVTAPGVGGGPHIKTYDFVTGEVTNRFYGDPADHSAEQWVVGDLDGDALVEIASVSRGLVSVYDFASGARVYEQQVAAGTLGVGGWFDTFGSALLAAARTGLGFEEFDPRLGVAVYAAVDYLGVPVTPGVYVYGTLGHPARAAVELGDDLVNGAAAGEISVLPGVAVDADTIGALETEIARSRLRPVPAGVSVGQRGTGTITAVVRDLQDGNRLKLLTNEHVLADEPVYTAPGRPVYQPGPVDAVRDAVSRVGVTGRAGGLRFVPGAENPIDAGLVEVDSGVQLAANTVSYDDIDGSPRALRITGVREALPGDLVTAISRTSYNRRNYVTATDVGLSVTYQAGRRAELQGQTITHGLFGGAAAQPGDSGSPVLLYDKFRREWYLTGQLFAGGGVVMVFTPISTVFAALGVAL